jgi:hypothetical protein
VGDTPVETALGPPPEAIAEDVVANQSGASNPHDLADRIRTCPSVEERRKLPAEDH